jgi:hypothetical protein
MRDQASKRLAKLLQAHQQGDKLARVRDWPSSPVKKAFAAFGLDPDNAEHCEQMLTIFSLVHFGRKTSGRPTIDEWDLVNDSAQAFFRLPKTRLIEQKFQNGKSMRFEVPEATAIVAFLRKHSKEFVWRTIRQDQRGGAAQAPGGRPERLCRRL